MNLEIAHHFFKGSWELDLDYVISKWTDRKLETVFAGHFRFAEWSKAKFEGETHVWWALKWQFLSLCLGLEKLMQMK